MRARPTTNQRAAFQAEIRASDLQDAIARALFLLASGRTLHAAHALKSAIGLYSGPIRMPPLRAFVEGGTQ